MQRIQVKQKMIRTKKYKGLRNKCKDAKIARISTVEKNAKIEK